MAYETDEICDIEDLHVEENEVDRSKVTASRQNHVKVKRKVNLPTNSKDLHVDSFIPGLQSVYVKTWGCSHNSSDSEYMAGMLAACGYNITDLKEQADLWLLNSCTVKTPAEQHFQNLINEAQLSGKYVVVAGCVPQAAPQTVWLKGLSIVGVQQLDRIAEVVEETLKGNSVRLLGQKSEKRKKLGGASLLLPKIRRNPLIEILAINTGCLNRCTYCKTKQARGDLGSYTIDELVARAQQSFEEGVKEIWLTSEDLGAYGRDVGVTLPDLLKELVEVIPEGCKMRLGMTNPPYILDHLEEIADVLNHPRVYKFLHIPVQSGSTAVLRDMKREYTREDFERVADFIRLKVPKVNIATDFICGFPTESDEDFKESMSLVVKYQFASLFINQFYPRPGTPAARMKRIDTVEVKRRTKLMSEYFRSYFPYADRVGEVYEALVTEEASDGHHYVAHNESYEQILVPKLPELMGQLVKVEIIATTKWSMEGRVLNNAELSANLKKLPAKGQVTGVDVYKRHFSSVQTVVDSQLSGWRAYGGQICMLLALLISFLLAVWMRSRREH